MAASSSSILAHLEAVEHERRLRAASPVLHAQVVGLKSYQQRRFSHTYADLLSTPRYAAAARFFLDELYGPTDFSQRDAQFARVVPALVRLFPDEVVETVATLARLHALSEHLDTMTARHLLPGAVVDGVSYIAAWQASGHAPDRKTQILLTLQVGQSLDRLTRKPLLRHSLRMMRGPARAAGLAALQGFLESGFDTFSAMRGAREFLDTVSAREHLLCDALFGVGATTSEVALGQLP